MSASGRRLAVAAVCVLVAMPATPTAATSTPALVRVDQAYAQWLFPTTRPHRFTGYAVYVRRTTEPGERSRVRAYVSDVRCTIEEGRRTCIGRGDRPYRVRLRDFAFDDRLGGVSVTFRTPSGTSFVRWRPAGEAGEREAPDGAYATRRWCSDGFGGGGAGPVQDANASGTIAGTRVTARHEDDAVYQTGLHAYRCGP